MAVIAAFLAVLASSSWLGSETLFYGYYIWQVPNFFAAWLTASVVTVFGSYAAYLASFAKWERKRVAINVSTAFRQARVTLGLLLAALGFGFASLGARAFRPDVSERLVAVFQALETHPSLYGKVESEVDEILKRPKFADNGDARFIKEVVTFRSRSINPKGWSPKEYSQWASSFEQTPEAASERRKAWAKCMAAECYAGMGYTAQAKKLYRLAATQTTSAYVRRLALASLGELAYFEGDSTGAITQWQAANAITEMRGTSENIAWVYAELGQWREAFAMMSRARELIEDLERDPEKRPLAVRYRVQNRAQMAQLHRKYAKTLSGPEADTELAKAVDELRVAHTESAGILDQYWVGVLVSIDRMDYVSGRKYIDEFNAACANLIYEKEILGYSEAPPYMLWLEIRLAALSGNSIPRDLLKRLDDVPIKAKSRPQKLYRILQNMEKTSVTIAEDIDALFDMIARNLLTNA